MKLAAKLFFGAIVAVAIAIWGVATVRDRAAERNFPPIGQMIEVQGGVVHAFVTGNGPDLVLIHGSGGNLRDFTMSLVDQVKDRYRVIAFDRPGMGYSDALPRGANGIHAQAKMLQEAAGKLGADKPIVLGQSYGGAVALAWALDMPESAAAVVNVSGPSHPWSTPLERYYRINSSRLGGITAVPIIAAIYRQAQVEDALVDIFAPQPVPEHYINELGIALTMSQARLRANAQHRAILKSEITALAPGYTDFPVPLEIVHGDADKTVSLDIHARQMVQDTDQARLTVLEGIGHMPQHVAPEAVIDAIDRAAARAGL